jgi:hypothetical protein
MTNLLQQAINCDDAVNYCFPKEGEWLKTEARYLA